jgi:hypothetical protein
MGAALGLPQQLDLLVLRGDVPAAVVRLVVDEDQFVVPSRKILHQQRRDDPLEVGAML